MMTNLNKKELQEINGGILLPVLALIIAAAALQVQIMEHCYEIGKD